MSTIDYYDRINLELLSMVPRTARLVLEVGCGAGAMGEAFKKDVPDCRYVGIECVDAAAAIACGRLDAVVLGNVEELTLDDLGVSPGTVDCLVYGDVLEHLVDPWKLLAEHRRLLSPDGLVLACIPNVQHWFVLANLMNGDWTYQDQGLLDRTHLRFFTYNSVMTMFGAAGFEVCTVVLRSLAEDDKAERFFEAMLPSLKALHIDPDQFRLRVGAYQWLVVARVPAAR